MPVPGPPVPVPVPVPVPKPITPPYRDRPTAVPVPGRRYRYLANSRRIGRLPWARIAGVAVRRSIRRSPEDAEAPRVIQLKQAVRALKEAGRDERKPAAAVWVSVAMSVAREGGAKLICSNFNAPLGTRAPTDRTPQPPSPVGSANDVAVTSPDITRCHGMSQGDRERSR